MSVWEVASVAMAVIAFAGLMALLIRLGPLVTNYKITEDAVVISLGRVIRVARISLADLTDIRVVRSWSDWKELILHPFYLQMGNRAFGRRGGVLLCRSRGLFRRILISPDEPDEFVQQARQHMDRVRHR